MYNSQFPIKEAGNKVNHLQDEKVQMQWERRGLLFVRSLISSVFGRSAGSILSPQLKVL